MMIRKAKSILNFIGIFLLTGCSLFEGPEDKKLFIAQFYEPAGASCEFGGIRIGAGIDSNRNKELEESEVTSFKTICRMKDSEGRISLFRITKTLLETGCPLGGLFVAQGFDSNNSQTLDSYLEEELKYVICFDDALGTYYVTRSFLLPGTEYFNNDTIISETGNIQNFNIDDFAEFDRVFFHSVLISEPNQQPEGTFKMELFNKTDGTPIDGSAVEGSDFERDLINGMDDNYYFGMFSNNCKDGFPHKPIELAIRVSINSPEMVYAYPGELKMVRDF